MKATCTNDPEHKRFVTLATVTQDWFVDEYGNCLYVYNELIGVAEGPDPRNDWECAVCGAPATVTE